VAAAARHRLLIRRSRHGVRTSFEERTGGRVTPVRCQEALHKRYDRER
jgi:hypothetical protein